MSLAKNGLRSLKRAETSLAIPRAILACPEISLKLITSAMEALASSCPAYKLQSGALCGSHPIELGRGVSSRKGERWTGQPFSLLIQGTKGRSRPLDRHQHGHQD